MAGRQLNQPITLGQKECFTAYHECACPLADKGREGRLDLAGTTCIQNHHARAEDALIGDFHIRRSLFGGAGPIYRLPRLVGLRKAKELMLTGKLLTGVQAKEWGLINECAPAEQLDECVDTFVADLTDKSPFAMWITKMAINKGLDADQGTLMVLEHFVSSMAMISNDASEGVAAFLEKRDPIWTGS